MPYSYTIRAIQIDPTRGPYCFSATPEDAKSERAVLALYHVLRRGLPESDGWNVRILEVLDVQQVVADATSRIVDGDREKVVERHWPAVAGRA